MSDVVKLVIKNDTILTTPVKGIPLTRRDCIFAGQNSAWTEYKGTGGITIHVSLIMDEETRAAIAALSKKADEALQIQLGGNNV